MWQYANHFDKSLPKCNPSPGNLNTYIDTLIGVCDFTYRKLHDCLLEHLQCLTTKHGIVIRKFSSQPMKSIDAIHHAVLSSATEYCDSYLSWVLEFIKLPQKLENKWFLKATQAVTEQYDIQFALGENFLSRSLQQLHSMTSTTRDFVMA